MSQDDLKARIDELESEFDRLDHTGRDTTSISLELGRLKSLLTEA